MQMILHNPFMLFFLVVPFVIAALLFDTARLRTMRDANRVFDALRKSGISRNAVMALVYQRNYFERALLRHFGMWDEQAGCTAVPERLSKALALLRAEGSDAKRWQAIQNDKLSWPLDAFDKVLHDVGTAFGLTCPGEHSL
jgi:hypothetical protein